MSDLRTDAIDLAVVLISLGLSLREFSAILVATPAFAINFLFTKPGMSMLCYIRKVETTVVRHRYEKACSASQRGGIGALFWPGQRAP